MAEEPPQLPGTSPEIPDAEFARWYGPASPLPPASVLRLFADAPFDWWVVGGWSLEADPRSPRRVHEDLDVAVPFSAVDVVRERLAGHHLWQTYPAMRPVLPHEPLPPNLHQIWVRRDAYSPWLMDLALTPVEDGEWFYRPDRRVHRPMAEVVRTGPDGLPYQVPEIGLLFKSRHARAKDMGDLHESWPRLGPAAQAWLRDALALVSPGHPWLAALA